MRRRYDDRKSQTHNSSQRRLKMANEKDRLGTIYTNPDPRGGPAPAGTLVTVYTSQGPQQGRVLNGVVMVPKTGNHA
jgi:hypothetical protein